MGSSVSKSLPNSPLGNICSSTQKDMNEQGTCKSITTNTSTVPEAQASILLIFGKLDKQTRWFEEAARKLNCRCNVMLVDYGSVESGRIDWTTGCGADHVIDLVIIDRRQMTTCGLMGLRTLASRYNCEAPDHIREDLCESPLLRDALIAGLIHTRSSDKQKHVYISTLEAGYNKCLFELTCVEDAERELLSFMHSELPLLRRCRRSSIFSKVSYRTVETPEVQSPSTPKLSQAIALPHSKSLTSENISPNVTVTTTTTMGLRPSQTTIRYQRYDSAQLSNPSNPDANLKVVDALTDSSFDRRTSEKRARSLTHFRKKRTHTRQALGNFSASLDRDGIYKMFAERYRESRINFSSLNVNSPLFKAVAILFATKTRCSSSVSKELQKAIDVICDSDIFAGQLLKPLNQYRDPLTVDLMEGLMVTATDKFPTTRTLSTVTHRADRHESMFHSADYHVTDEIKACLNGNDRWDYDILALEKITNNRPLIYLCMKVFARFNVASVLRIQDATIASWLSMIQENYHEENPYHNATHAADVLQSTAYLLRRDVLSSVFDCLEEVAALLAAVVHDLDHPGRTNPFLVNSNDQLAIMYNDNAVLENHHSALAFELTRNNPSVNIFQNLSRNEYRTVRGYMIDMVLATEMARHFDIVASFVNTVSKPLLHRSLVAENSSVGSMSSVDSGGNLMTSSTSQLTTTDETPVNLADHLAKPEVRAIVRRMIIKCSDVNNPTRPFQLCREWAVRIAEEYFAQTEEEKRLNLPIVMPNFDRQTCNIPKSQLSFIDFFLRDMFTAFDAFCPIPDLVKNLEANHAKWTRASQAEHMDDTMTLSQPDGETS